MSFPTWPASKDPNEVKDYTITWTDKLAGDNIATSVFTPETGLTKDSESNTTTVSKIWVSGGTHGETYNVHCRITTNSVPARTYDQTVKLKVKDK